MKKGSITAASLAIAILVAGCNRPVLTNTVSDRHEPAYQQVNTVEKARGVYAGTTLISKIYQFHGQDGVIYREVDPPVNFGLIETVDTAVEYFRQDGRVYRATSTSPEVVKGTWEIRQSGRTYPQLCRTYPTRPVSSECTWPNMLLIRESDHKLYRGDITGLGTGRYPTRLRRLDVTASSWAVAREFTADYDDFFNEQQIQ